MIVFGPIPSRRLGESIGVNNIPPKTCPYSCIYCQLGRTNKMQISRRSFYDPKEILKEAELKVEQLKKQNKHADYFSFVPDGEPTLDINLGKEIDLLKRFGIKIAVISNASLIWMDSVKNDLLNADWVSLSLDAADEKTWHKIDRPHNFLSFDKITKGIADFSKEYKGTLVTETMLVKGINDSNEHIEKLSEKIAEISPKTAYFLTPTRPPAEKYAESISDEKMKDCAALLHKKSGVSVGCITGSENSDGFFFSDNAIDDLLSIMSVHPVRESVVYNILKERDLENNIIDKLCKEKKILRFSFNGETFYRRNMQK